MKRRKVIAEIIKTTVGMMLIPTIGKAATNQNDMALNQQGYKKVAVIADIHGNSWALDKVLEDIHKIGVTEILNLGDTFYGPLDPGGTYQLMSKNNITSISGNMDRYIMELTLKPVEKPTIPAESPTMKFVLDNLDKASLAWISSLAKTKIFDDAVFMCHGNFKTDDLPLIEAITERGAVIRDNPELQSETAACNQSIILCAHTHVSRFMQVDNNRSIINPGSIGLPAYSDSFPYQYKMESFSPHAKYCILEVDNNNLIKVEHVSVVYNWKSAITAANKNHRPDWAKWLEFGRVD